MTSFWPWKTETLSAAVSRFPSSQRPSKEQDLKTGSRARAAARLRAHSFLWSRLQASLVSEPPRDSGQREIDHSACGCWPCSWSSPQERVPRGLAWALQWVSGEEGMRKARCQVQLHHLLGGPWNLFDLVSSSEKVVPGQVDRTV